MLRSRGGQTRWLARVPLITVAAISSLHLEAKAQETKAEEASRPEERQEKPSKKQAQSLGQQAVTLDELVVSGSPREGSHGNGFAPKSATISGKEAVPLLEIPNSVDVITRKRMDDQNMVTLDDALKEVPGVSVVPWNNSTSQYWVRGYNAAITYDGVPSYQTSSDWQQFDLSIYERVEVQKGPAGLLQGVGSPGATVNLVRKRGLAKPSAEAVLSAGSWDNYRGELDIGGPMNADGSVRSRFVVSKQNRGFVHRPTNIDKELIYGALDFDVTDRTTLSFAATYQNSLADSPSMGLPAFTNGQFLNVPRSTHVYPDWNQYRYGTYDMSAELRHVFDNKWVFAAKAHHRGQDRFWKDSFPAPNTGVDPLTMTATYTRRSADWDITYTGMDAYFSGPFEAWGQEHTFTFGYNFQSNGSTGKSVTLSPHISKVPVLDPNTVPEPKFVYTNGSDNRDVQGGFYSQMRLRLTDPLLLVAGARLSDFDADSRSIAPSPLTDWKQGAKVKNEFTPYAGLLYYLMPNITAYVSYSDIFIPQTATTVDGQVLDPRIGAQIETGLKGSFLNGNLDATLAIFRTRDQNRAMPDPMNPGFSIQAGEAEVEGVEIELRGSPLPNLQIAAGYTWLDSKYIRHQTATGQIFSLFEPEHSVKTYMRYSFDTPQLAGWSVAGGLNYSSGMVGTGENIRRQDDYVVLNAQVDYRINKHTIASLQVTNLLDEIYFARVGGLNTYNTYGEPRAYMLTLRSQF
jgi:outer membrane receptor for ferric coprogen and ferric-rhodotorulic acid